MLAIMAGIAGVVYKMKTPERAPTVLVVAPQSSPEPSPTLNPKTQSSPDKSVTVTLKSEPLQSQIFVSGQVVATIPITQASEVEIPFNTWSPDNKLLFVKEQTVAGPDYLVMRRDAKPLPSGDLTLSVGARFAQVHPDQQIADVTGWAAPTLLIVNAQTAENTKISYWVDLQTNKFIRLSDYFE